MFFKLAWRFSFLFIVLSSLGLTIWQSTIYDTTYFESLRAFFVSDCEAPCFIGIEVGETRSVDVESILQESDWVAQTESTYVQNEFDTVRFEWKQDAPELVQGTGVVNIWHQDVDWVSISTTATYGEILVALGSPTAQVGHPTEYRPFYDYANLILKMPYDCDMWEVQPSIIYLSQESDTQTHNMRQNLVQACRQS